jgi:hypothetical protein
MANTEHDRRRCSQFTRHEEIGRLTLDFQTEVDTIALSIVRASRKTDLFSTPIMRSLELCSVGETP